jgi:hypothetical protein
LFPFGVSFFLPFLIVLNALFFGVEFHAFVPFLIKPEKIIMLEAATPAIKPARFSDGLGHYKIGFLNPGFLYCIIGSLKLWFIGFLGNRPIKNK